MHMLNCRGNTDGSKFSFFWSTADQVVGMYEWAGYHKWRYAAADEEITRKFSYAPNVMSILQLVGKTKYLLIETDEKK